VADFLGENVDDSGFKDVRRDLVVPSLPSARVVSGKAELGDVRELSDMSSSGRVRDEVLPPLNWLDLESEPKT